MKKLLIISSVIVFCFSGSVFAQSEQKYPNVKRSQAMVGGIGLSSSEKEVRKAFGKVIKEKTSIDEMAGGEKGLVLYFKGVQVYLVGGKVFEISCIDEKYSTPDGIKIGSSEDEVIKKYGKGEEKTWEGKKYFKYIIDKTDCYLSFTLVNKMVTGINIWFDYK